MKQFTHAWLAFMAIKRLEDAVLSPDDHEYADSLIKWFKSNKDGVIRGAWYPDSLIKDNSNSHVLKFAPSNEPAKELKQLPEGYLSYKYSENSPVRNKGFKQVDEKDNLPDRCESFTESVVDHLKVQKSEEKGSAVSPTNNQVALWLFMLSHYVADAHVPFHCDGRKFSEEANIHGEMEGEWDKEIGKYYEIDESDKKNERFFYDPGGYPLRDPSKDQEYTSSYLKKVEDELSKRKFSELFGTGNNNVRDFMNAICQRSYLLSYYFLPEQYTPDNVKPPKDWKTLGGLLSFEDLSVAVLADAIDSIARIWFRAWRRYAKWEKGQG
ncbi:MAG: hypothetical protein ABSF21_08120 [Dehalococcoidia bacterium]